MTDPDSRYDALEASIQLARYAVVRRLCHGRRVLDIAAGEGYGASYMMRWGASQVTGVEQSEDAVERARASFGESATFVRGDLLEADRLLAGQMFDLVVSLETIQNVADPERFLQVLRTLAAPGATLVISCPNDAWYFGGARSRSPYHLASYTIEDFRDLAERALGEASHWALGAPVAGFGSVPARVRLDAAESDERRRLLGAVDAESALVVPADAGQGPDAASAAYFLGLWGPGGTDLPPAVVVSPLSMGVFEDVPVSAARWQASGVFSPWTSREVSPIERRLARLEGELVEAQAVLDRSREDLERSETERRHGQLRLEGERAELALAVDSIARMRTELEELRLAAARYRRLRDMVPAPLRRVMMLTYRRLQGRR